MSNSLRGWRDGIIYLINDFARITILRNRRMWVENGKNQKLGTIDNKEKQQRRRKEQEDV